MGGRAASVRVLVGGIRYVGFRRMGGYDSVEDRLGGFGNVGERSDMATCVDALPGVTRLSSFDQKRTPLGLDWHDTSRFLVIALALIVLALAIAPTR